VPRRGRAGVAPHPSREARAVVEVGVELVRILDAFQRISQRIPAVAKSNVGRGAVGVHNDISTSLIGKLLYHRANLSGRSHLP